MSQTNYQPVFKVEVSHTYFDKNICRCLCFKPGPVTSSLLSRFGIRKRDNMNGFDLFINSRTPLPEFLGYISNTTGSSFFDFEIETIAPAFNLFTELIPTNWVGKLVYDSGSELNTNENGQILLGASLSPGGTSFLGSLTIHFDDIIKTANQGFAQYAISYTARATQWQYLVINKSAVQLDNPAISGKAGINFIGPQNVTMDNAEQALLFTSGDNLLPLSEVPKYKFDLVNNTARQTGQKPSSAKVIFKGLPSPHPSRIAFDKAGNTGRIVSPMYVYV